MPLTSWLQRIFSPPSTGNPDDEEEDSQSFVWNQNARIVLALCIVFISALVVYWILS